MTTKTNRSDDRENVWRYKFHPDDVWQQIATPSSLATVEVQRRIKKEHPNKTIYAFGFVESRQISRRKNVQI